MGTVSYTKRESVKIELDEDEVEKAVRIYLSNQVTIPDGVRFMWLCGQEEFSGVSISWDEAPPTTVESTSY